MYRYEETEFISSLQIDIQPKIVQQESVDGRLGLDEAFLRHVSNGHIHIIDTFLQMRILEKVKHFQIVRQIQTEKLTVFPFNSNFAILTIICMQFGTSFH